MMKIILLIIGFILVLGLFLFTFADFFSFTASGTVQSIKNGMFLNVFTHSNFFILFLSYFFISLIASYFVFFSKSTGLYRGLYASLILIMVLFLFPNFFNVRKNTSEFNNLLDIVKYPNVSIYEFSRADSITSNKLGISFIATDEISKVLDYYRTGAASKKYGSLKPNRVGKPREEGKFTRADISIDDSRISINLSSELDSGKTSVSTSTNP